MSYALYGDPLWQTVPPAAQAVVATAVIAGAGWFGWYKFLHQRIGIPKVQIEIDGDIESGGARSAVFKVVVKNIGETAFTVLSTYLRDSEPGEHEHELPISHVQLFGLSNDDMDHMRKEGQSLEFDHNEWRGLVPLQGQWRNAEPGTQILGPNEVWETPLAIPLPPKTDIAFVSVRLGVVHGAVDTDSELVVAEEYFASAIVRPKKGNQ